MTDHRGRPRTVYTKCLKCGEEQRPDLRVYSSGICRICTTAYMRVWRAKDPTRQRKLGRESVRRYNQRVRAEVLAAYGGKCVCCGEATPEFLALDHVAGDGTPHRKAVAASGGVKMYRWARANGYPATLQLLCHNCNTAFGHYGYCPHGTLPPRPIRKRKHEDEQVPAFTES